MSKIFEALKRAQEEGAEMGFPFVAAEAASGGHPEVDNGNRHEHVREPEAPKGGAVAVAEAPPVEIRQAALRVAPESVVLPFDGERSRASEQYRVIRTKIVQHPRQPRLIAVSSASAGDGKTVSAINLARVLALRSEVNVLLIDADFRRSNIAGQLGIPSEPGLADVLAGEAALQDAVVRIESLSNYYVLPAGSSRPNPAELLDSSRWKAVCEAVRGNFDYAIVDVPPVAAVADYEVIQATCDGVILVVRPDHTDRTLFLETFNLVPKEKLIGVVINCAYEWFLWRTHESYYYGSDSR